MGYLNLPSGINDFSKAIISIWFRIPSATLAIMSAISTPPPPGNAGDQMDSLCYYPPLYKTIPLMTFGSIETDGDGKPVQPSFIGVDALADGTPVLACCLQTPVSGSVVSTFGNTGPVRPGCFYMGGYAADPFTPNAANTNCSADTWHHALISFDIGGSQTVNYDSNGGMHPAVFTSASSFTWAVDDASKVGASMRPSGGSVLAPGLAANQIITNWLVENIGFDGHPGPTPPFEAGDTATFSGGYIKSNGNPVGIPADATFVNNIYQVDMYRPQMWIGQDLDASVSDNRRFFIGADRHPVAESVSIAALGTPNIVFKNTRNFRNGTNTGTSGNFTPFNTINPFSPGP